MAISANAAYKPVDVSDIKGEQKKALAELSTELKRMPVVSRECFICEQLGLCFSKDGSRVLRSMYGCPAVTNNDKAYFVGKGKKLIRWTDARNAVHEKWTECWDATRGFKAEAPFVQLKKEVQDVVCNTAVYLLRAMPDEHRRMILALMGNMVYNDQGLPEHEREKRKMENGISITIPFEEGRGYAFLDPEGTEHDINRLLNAGSRFQRWREVIWRCENLVGSKDILALFSGEVKVMRKRFKERTENLEEQRQDNSKRLLEQADALLQDMPPQERDRLIAEAVGLAYKVGDAASGVYDLGQLHVFDNVVIYLSDGTCVKGAGKHPNASAVRVLMCELQHQDILEHYFEPIKKMAVYIARDRLKDMPSLLRDALRAELGNTLTTVDGSSATNGTIDCEVSYLGRTQRKAKIPHDKVVRDKALFPNSTGKDLPYNVVSGLIKQNAHSVEIIYLCAYILGKEGIIKLFREIESQSSGSHPDA